MFSLRVKCFIVAASVLIWLLFPVSVKADSLVVQISVSTDDVGHREGSWATSSESHLWGKSASYEYSTGWRFLNITIAQGSTIDSVRLHFCSYEVDTDNTYTKMYCFDEDNTATFSTWADFDGRAVTTAVVDVDLTEDLAYLTYVMLPADFKTIVQEVVNRGTWTSGNALGFKCVNDTTVTSYIRMTTYDAGEPDGDYAAIVRIFYSAGAGGETLLWPFVK